MSEGSISCAHPARRQLDGDLHLAGRQRAIGATFVGPMATTRVYSCSMIRWFVVPYEPADYKQLKIESGKAKSSVAMFAPAELKPRADYGGPRGVLPVAESSCRWATRAEPGWPMHIKALRTNLPTYVELVLQHSLHFPVGFHPTLNLPVRARGHAPPAAGSRTAVLGPKRSSYSAESGHSLRALVVIASGRTVSHDP